jgi:hypothetical protein
MSSGSLDSASLTGRVVKNLALVAATAVLVFIVAELIARAAYHPENLGSVIRFDETLGWSLRPRATSRSVDYQRNLDYLIRINSLGMREREIARGKPTGRRRVLLLGDSVTFGTGVNAGWRFSDFMQRALTDDVEVVNAGVPGWGTDQELIYYESFARELESDVVIVTFTMANDVVNNALDHLFLGSAAKPRFDVIADSLFLADGVPPRAAAGRPMWKSVLRQSRVRFLLFVKRRIDRMIYARDSRESHHPDRTTDPVPAGFHHGGKELTHWSVFEAPPSPRIEDAWKVTEAILIRFANRCRDSGAELIVLALPPRIVVDKRWRSDLMAAAGLGAEDLDFAGPFERLSSFCRKNGIPFVHPRPAFEEGARYRVLYHRRDSHPNRYGHALAARVLLETLKATQDLEFELAESDRQYMGPR